MVSHAYLLSSDDYELISEYSKCMAQQLLCDDNICDTCSNCMRVNHNTHTDVLVYPKEDAKQLLTNDILEIISSSYVSGGERYKVFILKNFDKTNTQAQNKFLQIRIKHQDYPDISPQAIQAVRVHLPICNYPPNRETTAHNFPQ